MTYSNHNTKYTEPRKAIKICKGKKTPKVTSKGRPMRVTPDFSTETLKARNSWTNVLQALKNCRYYTRSLYVAKLSITIEGEKHLMIKINLNYLCLHMSAENTRR